MLKSRHSIWDAVHSQFKHFKVPLDGQTSLNLHTLMSSLSKEWATSLSVLYVISQSGPRDEVQEELDRDEPASKQPGK